MRERDKDPTGWHGCNEQPHVSDGWSGLFALIMLLFIVFGIPAGCTVPMTTEQKLEHKAIVCVYAETGTVCRGGS